MFGGIVQFGELVVNHNLHPFLIFFVLCWGIFAYRLIMSRKNKPLEYKVKTRTTMSALILTFHDEVGILRKSLTSLKNQILSFDELIVIVDAQEDAANLEVIRESGFDVFVDEKGSKRDGYVGGFKQSKGEIVAMLSGDTIYPLNMVEEAQKAFSHSEVGGVGFRQRIYDRNKSLIRKFADIMYDLRYKLVYPCLSSRGALLCTTGETAFYRRGPIQKHLSEFEHEYFLGKRCLIGDDRFLTSMVLKEGYKVVLQTSTEPAYTDCPTHFWAFVKQQLRWYRSNQRYSIKTLFMNWIPGVHPVLKVHLAGFLILPYLWLGVLAWWIINTSLGIYPVEIITWSFYLTLPVWIIGFFLAMYCKSILHFQWERHDIKYFPLYVSFVVTVILPVFVYALLTIRKQGEWGTVRTKGYSGRLS